MKLDGYTTPSYGKEKRPRFITFEGIEGSGKTTQITLLKEALEKEGKKVLCLREPGGTQFGENLRKAILESTEALHPMAELHLFLAARTQLLHQVILPHLEKSEDHLVLVDRYLDSSLVYQGLTRGLGINKVFDLHKSEPLSTLPHLTIVLHLDYDEVQKRMESRGEKKDYFEKENKEFYEKIIKGFKNLPNDFPKRVHLLLANQEIETLSKQILELYKTQKAYELS